MYDAGLVLNRFLLWGWWLTKLDLSSFSLVQHDVNNPSHNAKSISGFVSFFKVLKSILAHATWNAAGPFTESSLDASTLLLLLLFLVTIFTMRNCWSVVLCYFLGFLFFFAVFQVFSIRSILSLTSINIFSTWSFTFRKTSAQDY